MVNIRLLTEADLSQFLIVLKALKSTNLSLEEARRIFSQLNSQVYVAEKNGEILGTAALLLEQKFINQGGKVAHIEDVAVRQDIQTQGIGKLLIRHLIDVASKASCYKIILDCKPELISYYNQFGFQESDRHLRLNLIK